MNRLYAAAITVFAVVIVFYFCKIKTYSLDKKLKKSQNELTRALDANARWRSMYERSQKDRDAALARLATLKKHTHKTREVLRRAKQIDIDCADAVIPEQLRAVYETISAGAGEGSGGTD